MHLVYWGEGMGGANQLSSSRRDKFDRPCIKY